MGGSAMLDGLWCIDDLVPRAGPLNMAIDEALLNGLSAVEPSRSRPVLRFYRWCEPCVSVGYFESIAAARTMFPRRTLVRRWTGGGVVAHGQDLTYSLLIPRSRLPVASAGAFAYEEIHAAIVTALVRSGVTGGSLLPSGGTPSSNTSRECFQKPVSHDVLLGGCKVAGAAQRRTRQGLLHQGSIQAPSTGALSTVFAPGGELHEKLVAALPFTLAYSSQTRCLSAAELAAAETIAEARYACMDWLEKF